MIDRTTMKYVWLAFLCAVLYPSRGKSEKYWTARTSKNASDTARPKSFADLTGDWQLLVDDYLVEKKEHVQRTYHPFTKYAGNPVLVADKPWEGSMVYIYGTVLPNENATGYRIWYQAWGKEYRNLYATSRDGLTWEKPELGIIDYNGSKANNIFLRRTKEDHLPQVIYTPWEKDPNRRYKLLNYDYGRTKPDHLVSGFWGAYSSDGIHWTDVPQNPVLKDPGDVGNFVWDAHTGRYIGYPKIFTVVRGFNRRCVGFTATKDFEHWPSAQLIMVPDEADDLWASLKNQRTEFYGLSAFPYESGYLGFLWIFHITDGKNDGPIYCELVSSRDGISWIRQEVSNGKRLSILPVGQKGAWDQGMIFTPNHPLVENNIIKLWYGGSKATHDAPDASVGAGIGLATLRKDGFASLDATGSTGIVTTKLLKNLHGPLLVNANAAGGSLTVEVVGRNGGVVRGFSRSECKVVRMDSTSIQVSWRNHMSLPDSREPFRLRFILQNASLYSFNGGADVDVFDPAQPQDIHLTFKKADQLPPYRLYGPVSVAADPDRPSKASESVNFPFDTLYPTKIEILNTTDLGARFTLSAMVKTNRQGPMRLFSNYRGSGDLASGELLFDFDPAGKKNPGLRFNVNGQTVQSRPLAFHDGKFHLLAVTYDLGLVILYLDGKEVGRGRLQFGAAHLVTDKNIRRYFELPDALPEVGIHLGNNLFFGADADEHFMTYKEEVTPVPQAQFTGKAKHIGVDRKVLTASEIQKLFRIDLRPN